MEGLSILVVLLIVGVAVIVYGLIRWRDTDETPPESEAAKPTILVVDDDGEIRRLLLDAFGRDYTIVEAANGLFGLSEIASGEQKIDLIVTDLKMPEVDGVEFIRNLPEDVPYIVISAYLQTSEFHGSLKGLEPVAVLAKPFKISALRAIQKGLAQSPPRQTASETA
ncbi:MAG: response regulator [Candidatus Latescibacteria bacterium]|jgi:CheY-like chemotaxis protein|nr:response regulator [Candidatus Latescibacterota bacterium]